MKDRITEILHGDIYPNVYRLNIALSLADLERLDRDEGTKLFYFDGTKIIDRASLFQEFATIMEFPEYFGHNWDALADCLTELDGHEVDRYIIAIDRLDKFATNDPYEWETFVDICKSAIEYWQDTETPMYILLHGNSTELTCTDILLNPHSL